jgi:hypothetical protein
MNRWAIFDRPLRGLDTELYGVESLRKDVTRVIFNPMLLKKFEKLFLEGLLAVILFLIVDVSDGSRHY